MLYVTFDRDVVNFKSNLKMKMHPIQTILHNFLFVARQNAPYAIETI